MQSAEDDRDCAGSYLDCIEMEESEPANLLDQHEREPRPPSSHSIEAFQSNEGSDMRQLAAAGSKASCSEVLMNDDDIWEPETSGRDELEAWLCSIECAAETAAFQKVRLSSDLLTIQMQT